MAGIEFINKLILELQQKGWEITSNYSFKNKFVPVDSSHWTSSHQFLGDLISNNTFQLDPRQIELKARNIINLISKFGVHT